MAHAFYEPFYQGSHALVIGINKYLNCGPLAFAVNDATAIAASLRDRHGFPEANVTLLTDGDATRATILSAYMKLSDPALVGDDDRLFVFFAGHGHTATGRRGETGFLVPVDGDPDDLSTLIKWGELTGSADLIAAKHIFFLMDACYGGLAITRKPVPAGSMRLLKDMMQRFSRQVLTAGKADEVVSDGGGTRPGHSIFTSHVLDALDGAASATEGVVTANGLMSYVYQQVGTDPLSNQTPHYGFLEGDGDFIFSPVLTPTPSGATDDQTLVQTPSFSPPTIPSVEESVSEKLKRLIAVPADKIRLDDFVTAHLRLAIQEIGLDKFPVQHPFSAEEFARRVKAYEDAVVDLEAAVILLARWAGTDQIPLLAKIFSRLAECDKGESGLVIWLNLGWYPVQLLMYAAGIAALSEGRYDTLKACFLTPVLPDRHGSSAGPVPVIIPSGTASSQVSDGFKTLPDMERRYTPRSDHMFQTLQPILEDHLFLGKNYERLFDEFEAMLALVYADVAAGDEVSDTSEVWGPPGRFGWRHRYSDGSIFQQLVSTVEREKRDWSALKAGLFRSDPDRFKKINAAYQRLVSRFGWY